MQLRARMVFVSQLLVTLNVENRGAMYDAFPLTWPIGWQRTQIGRRKSSRYQVSFGQARDDLVNELCLFGCNINNIVISTNVPIRRDGFPYSGMREPDDPGVAAYWVTKDGTQNVIACDAWRTVRENLRAVGLAVQGLRLIQRTQATEILQRAFSGFAALPATSSLPSWATVLGFSSVGGLTIEDVETAYRSCAMNLHPDRGGNHDAMVRLNQARDDAKRAVIAAQTNGAP